MYCIKCGQKISEEMDFCPKCGTAIDSKLYEDELTKKFEGDAVIETNKTEEHTIEQIEQNHSEKNESKVDLNKGDLNKNEYYVSFINASMDVKEGTLFLTTQRLFFKSLDEGFLWGCYLSDITSHNLEDKDGVYSLLINVVNLNRLFCINNEKGKKVIDFYKLLQRVQNKSFRNDDILFDESETEDEDIVKRMINDEDAIIDGNTGNNKNVSGLVIVIVAIIVTAFIGMIVYKSMSNNNQGEIGTTVKITEMDLVANTPSEAEEIAKEQLNWGNRNIVLEATCVLTPEGNPYGGYVVQVVLVSGKTKYVKFDTDGQYSGISDDMFN